MREERSSDGRVTRRSGTRIGGAPVEREQESARENTRDSYREEPMRRPQPRYAYHDYAEDFRREDERDARREDYRGDYRREEGRREDYRGDYRREEGRREDYRGDNRREEGRREDYRGDNRREEGRREEAAPAAKKQEPQQSVSRSRNPDRTVHQLVPYALLCLAPFAAVSFILRDIYHLEGEMGAFGNFFANFLCGLFGVVAYIVPLFMFVLALRWRKYVTKGKLAKKLILSAMFLLLLSGIIHVFKDGARAVVDTTARTLYDNGVLFEGGGFFGGFFGEWMGGTVRLPGTCMLAMPLLLIVTIYLFDKTPHGVWVFIAEKIRVFREHRRERQAAMYDGKEQPAEKTKEKNTENPPTAHPRTDTGNRELGWCEPRPIEIGGVKVEPNHYTFSDEEDDPLPAPIRRRTTSSVFLDIAQESKEPPVEKKPAVTEAPVLPAQDPEEVLKHAVQATQHEEDTLLTQQAPKTPAPEKKQSEGQVYSPFSLPIRPFPKKEQEAASKEPSKETVQVERTPVQAPIVPKGTPVAPFGGDLFGEETEQAQEDAVKEEVLGTPVAPFGKQLFEEKPKHAEESTVKEETLGTSVAPFGEQLFEEKPKHAEENTVKEETLGTPVAPFGGALFEEKPKQAEQSTAKEETFDTFIAPTDKTPLQEESPRRLDSFSALFDRKPEEKSVTREQPSFGDTLDTENEDWEEELLQEEEPVAPLKDDRADKRGVALGWEKDFSLSEESCEDELQSESELLYEKDEELEEEELEEPQSLPQAPKQETPAQDPLYRFFPPRVEKKPEISVKTEHVEVASAPAQEPVIREYCFPPLDMLNEDTNKKNTDHTEELQEKIDILRQTLADFNVRVKEQVECSRGPTITRYELRPEAGVSVRQVINRIDDISLNLAAPVRIEAPIPGKPAIGIEVPNAVRETVYMRTMLESEEFKRSTKPLEIPLGLGIGGDVQMCNLASMPHLLVAGTTGSGKSVCINTILIGLMYKTTPEDLRLILIDPKQIEFAPYEHIPHLYMPIVTDMQRAAGALACAVQEMERRYSLIKDVGVRDIDSYNKAVQNDPEREHLPRIVIVIDEFADLKMSCANNDPENFTCRLAQKARAAGIYLIIGTQRPSVDVITGKLKNNIPSRIAFTVKQQVDSRTILDMNGAESLTGKGDMLYMPTGCPKPARVQGAFVSDGELERVLNYVRKHNAPVQYNKEFMEQIEIEMARTANAGKKDDYDDLDDEGGEDPKFVEAVELAVETQKVATSLLQRRLGVGYGRAAKIIDRMEELGLVSAAEGNKPRKLLPAAQGYLDHIRAGSDYDDEENFE